MIFAQARCFHSEMRFDFSGEHLPRMTFHPFLAMHAATKISPISAGFTRSSDILALLAKSAAIAGRSRSLGARSRMRAYASQA
jgi:hypothetical protein